MKTIVRLTEQQIDNIFEAADSQSSYLMGLYYAVIDDWDSIERIEGWPGCNSRLWEHIARKAIEWDKLHCPEVFAGGAWLNNGFTSATVRDWCVTLATCKIIRKTAKVEVVS